VGFLAPAFLIGALAVGLPLYLHLLRRNTSTPLPFSSLMLFEPRQQSATRRRRLRYWLLLALRLAVVFLLVLAFAEPYVNRFLVGAAPEKLQWVVVDNSFSMRAGTRLADAKRAAMSFLSQRSLRDRAQIVALGAQVHVLTQATQDAGALRTAVDSIQLSDSRGSFGVLASAVRSIAENERAPIELHLFSDLQRTNMPPSFTDMVLPRNVSLVLHPVSSGLASNWAVEGVSAPPQVWDPRTAHVQAVVVGYGTPAATRTVSFVVNGKTIATRRVDVPASGRATAEIDSLELPYGFSRCSVKIDSADSLPADDEYVFAIERLDRKRGLFVSQSADTRSALYFDTALGAAAQSAVVLDKMTVDRVADVDPSSYAFIVISDVAALPTAFSNRVLDYVRRGGSVLIALGTTAAQQREVPFFGGKILALRHYSRDVERFAAVGQTDGSYAPAGSPDEWEGVKFYYAASVDEHDAHVVARLQDRTGLLLEKAVGEGRVTLFASGFDNLTNDLPLHPVFVAFVERITRYLSGNEARGGPHLVDDLIGLRTAKEQAVGVQVIDPTGARALSLQEAVSSQSYAVTRGGFYEVRLANGRRDLVAANPDRRESDLATIPDEVLALWRGGNPVTPVVTAAGVSSPPDRMQGSLWWYAMLCLLVAALAESAIGGRYLATLRDEP